MIFQKFKVFFVGILLGFRRIDFILGILLGPYSPPGLNGFGRRIVGIRGGLVLVRGFVFG